MKVIPPCHLTRSFLEHSILSKQDNVHALKLGMQLRRRTILAVWMPSREGVNVIHSTLQAKAHTQQHGMPSSVLTSQGA